MLVIIRYPYVLKNKVREELIDKYTQMIRSGDGVLISDPMVKIEVYENVTDGYVAEIVTADEFMNELIANSYRYNLDEEKE